MTQPPPGEQNPFVAKEVPCPICLLPSRQLRLKKHLYMEQERDIDLRTRTYVWKSKGLAHLHPPLYHMWHCRHCRFTASQQAFENPVKELRLTIEQARKAMQRVNAEDASANRVITVLSHGLEGPQIDHQQAARLHLLAIYDLLLLARETGVGDVFNLARYLLRLAWLYRDIAQSPQLGQSAGAALAKVAAVLARDWPEIPASDFQASLQAAAYYQAVLNDPQRLEEVGEVGDLQLLVARILIQQKRLDEAKLAWGRAHEMARGLEVKKKDLERQSSQWQEKIRTSPPALAQSYRDELKEVTARLVRTDAAARSLRNKVQQARDPLEMLEEDLGAAAKPAAPQAPAKKKGFKGLFG